MMLTAGVEASVAVLCRRVAARTAPRAARGRRLTARTAAHNPCRRALPPLDINLAPAASELRGVGAGVGAGGPGSCTGASCPRSSLTQTRLLTAARLGRGNRAGSSRSFVVRGWRAVATPDTRP